MAIARSARRPAKKIHQGSATILLIAIFKLAKGIMLVLVGLGMLRLLRGDVENTVLHWVDLLRVDPDNRHIHGLLARVLTVTPRQLRAFSVGTFIYAGVFLTEGTGLLLRKKWAEYFTIVTTAGLIPLEVYEIARHLTLVKIGVLLVNVAIVVYLTARIRRNPA